LSIRRIERRERCSIALARCRRELGIRDFYGRLSIIGMSRWCQTHARQKDYSATQASDFHDSSPTQRERTRYIPPGSVHPVAASGQNSSAQRKRLKFGEA
jgi:hypothetical protein